MIDSSSILAERQIHHDPCTWVVHLDLKFLFLVLGFLENPRTYYFWNALKWIPSSQLLNIALLLCSIFSFVTLINWPIALYKARNDTWAFYMQQNLSGHGMTHFSPRAQCRACKRLGTISTQRMISLSSW